MYQVNDEKTNQLLFEVSNLIKEFTDLGLEIWQKKMLDGKVLRTDLASNLLYRQILEMSDAIEELMYPLHQPHHFILINAA